MTKLVHYRFPILRFLQHAGKLGLALGASFGVFPQNLAQASCENVKDTGTVCTFDPTKEELRLFWRGTDASPFGAFDDVAKSVAARGGKLTFAMNAGMYQPDMAPVGLYIEDGEQRHPVNLRAGDGNFGLRPNGVFWIDGAHAGVVETGRFIASGIRPKFATQSGPMLVIGGHIHPKIRPTGTSQKLRNGVGVCQDGRVRFVISDAPVTFFQFASTFRDRLNCPDALFLDGSISSLYAPNLGRNDAWRPIGPIVGAVERK